MIKEPHEMTIVEARNELKKMRSELCIKYYDTGNEELKKRIKAITIVLDNYKWFQCIKSG